MLAYVRSFDLADRSAKFDVTVPTLSFTAHALMNGEPREREMSGLGDPRFVSRSICLAHLHLR
jgi:hypothetical protein